MSSLNSIPEKNTVLLPLANKDKSKIQFSLWAPLADDVKINVQNDDSSFTTFKMNFEEETGLWKTEIPYKKSFFYTYSVTNAGVTKTCLDPYAISMAAYTNDGTSGIAAYVDLDDENAKPYTLEELKSQLTAETYEYLLNHQKKATFDKAKSVIYEISVRDATINDSSTDFINGTKSINAGTYLKFIEKLPYFCELGITHIQLLPVLNFYNNDETNKNFEDAGTVHKNNYNWGYDPHNYFTPEGWFSSNSENPYSRVKELRTLVSIAHSVGLFVTLDVVYNHMARTCFLNDIVPGYYFRLNEDGTNKNNSFCGNDTDSEKPMMRKLIQDSLKFWTKYYDVDGFRFDIMGLIDSTTMTEAFEMCKEIKPSTFFIGEGWKLYNGSPNSVGLDQNFMTQTDDIAVFNDEFRDLCKAGGFNEHQKAFLTGGIVDLTQLFYNCIGLPQKNYTADNPLDSVLYIDCHDGLTLHDSICLNSELNDDESEKLQELEKRLKLANALLLTSQGIPFIHAGQEFGRTKSAFKNAYTNDNEIIGAFVKNSYDSSDNINQLLYEKTIEKQNVSKNLIEYTKGLIDLRKTQSVFTLANKELILRSITQIQTNNPQVLTYTIKYKGETWVCCFNASKEDFSLNIEGSAVEIFVDNQTSSSSSIGTIILNSDSSINVGELSALVCKVKSL